MNNINGLRFCFWLKRALIFLQDQFRIVCLGQGSIVIIVAKRPTPNSREKVTRKILKSKWLSSCDGEGKLTLSWRLAYLSPV